MDLIKKTNLADLQKLKPSYWACIFMSHQYPHLKLSLNGTYVETIFHLRYNPKNPVYSMVQLPSNIKIQEKYGYCFIKKVDENNYIPILKSIKSIKYNENNGKKVIEKIRTKTYTMIKYYFNNINTKILYKYKDPKIGERKIETFDENGTLKKIIYFLTTINLEKVDGTYGTLKDFIENKMKDHPDFEECYFVYDRKNGSSCDFEKNCYDTKCKWINQYEDDKFFNLLNSIGCWF